MEVTVVFGRMDCTYLWRSQATVLTLFLLLLVMPTAAKRYRYCGEGCCPHEFCAFHKICYPYMSCSFGCPDGVCTKGVCMPTAPCQQNTLCPMAHLCTYNFNLGYNTCQYNLDIGMTTCVDRDGHSLLKKGT
ncbi:uncharacterized protein LOC135481959 isoform X2 [Liolophura sinensis]|uniref:uncharacterized protein LOC135481959 isoform X2 n=1 Tax=Liolophura sinensis TaxID=3198878 RepID=UPI0031598FA8